jgi:predicted nucleotidyltransferase
MAEPAVRGLQAVDTSREETFADVLRCAVEAIEGARVAYALIGGVGSAALGRPRWTRDIDIIVTPVDADRALDALGAAGFDTERTNEHWIFKATKDEIVVDLIFRTVGDIYLDEPMKERAMRVDFLGVHVTVAAPEDQIVIKAIAHDEQSSRHWNDALGLLASQEIDWEYLLTRAARGAKRVLSLLIYAQSVDLIVPTGTIEHLYKEIYVDAR